MDFQRVARLGLLGFALSTLIVGGVTSFIGLQIWSDRAFALGTAVVLVSLVITVIRSLAKGEVGLDLVA